MYATTSSAAQPIFGVASSSPSSSPSKQHRHAASVSALQIAVDLKTPDDSHSQTKRARRHSSSCTARLLRGDSLCQSDSSWFAHDSPPTLPRITVINDNTKQDPFDGPSMTFHGLLDELESLARTVRQLPIPEVPTASLSAWFDAVDLTMTPGISTQMELAALEHPYESLDRPYDFVDKPWPEYRRTLDEDCTHIINIDDSGYVSDLSSPAFSGSSLFDDLERTPRGPRPRAPSPLTPLTPNFEFSPTLPHFFSPYAEAITSSPVTPVTPEFSPTSPISLEDQLPPPESAARTLQRQPSKPNFLQSMLGRRRPELKPIRVPDTTDPFVSRALIDAPRTASFLSFKDAKRGLRRQKSEDMFTARKAASVDDLELESFFNF